MIYRRTPAFIFVHIPKTGGTSVENALSEAVLSKPVSALSRQEVNEYLLPAAGTVHQHYRLRDFEERCGIDPADFFVFAFVRNPWDLVVSEIMFFKEHEKRTFNEPRFADNVRKLLSLKGRSLWGHTFEPQTEHLKSRTGKVAVNYIGRFETLQKDYDRICEKLGLKPSRLPWLLRTSSGRPHYSRLYDNETRGLVETHYQEDIRRFGFSF